MANESIFSKRVLNMSNKQFKDEVRKNVIGSKELKKEVQRILQQANRRAENLENQNIFSLALQKRIDSNPTFFNPKSYSKWSITGLDFTNKNDWIRIQQVYADAVNFLNSPTSTVRGAKEYSDYVATKYKIPKDIVGDVIYRISESKIKNYTNKSFYQLLKSQLNNDVQNVDTENVDIINAFANGLENTIKAIEEKEYEIIQNIDDNEKNFARSLPQGKRFK